MRRKETSLAAKVLIVLGVVGLIGFLQWLVETVLGG